MNINAFNIFFNWNSYWPNISFSTNNNETDFLTKSDYEIFEANETIDDEIINIKEGEGIYTVTQSNLDGHEKGWRLSTEDGNSFQVTILDKRFLNDVKNGLYSFTHGTAIEIRYNDITRKKINITHEFEIIEVISLYQPNSKIPKIVRKNHKLFDYQIN